MTDKDPVKRRFLEEFLGAVADWDIHILEYAGSELNAVFIDILKEQEEFGNKINFDCGRELWYSNDFFINCLILEFMDNVQDNNKLFEFLKTIWVGLINRPEPNAEALYEDNHFEGNLITFNYEMQINIELISELVAYHLYGGKIEDEIERVKLLPEMAKLTLFLFDKRALLEEATKVVQEGKNKLTWPGSVTASELFVASMKFVLGHEIGHHYLGHTASNRIGVVSNSSQLMHAEEISADNFGFDLLITGGRKDNDLFAPLIVILMLALYDRSPESSSEDHPSLRSRYLNLLNKISEVDENVSFRLQEIFNHIASWFHHSLRKDGYWNTEWWKR